MGKLRPDWTGTATILPAQTSCVVRFNPNIVEVVWVIEQISIRYSNPNDAPQVSIVKNGNVFSGAAQFLLGNNGLAQTFAGQPYMYVENDDAVSVNVDNGTAGAAVFVQFQYRIIGYDSDELAGRF